MDLPYKCHDDKEVVFKYCILESIQYLTRAPKERVQRMRDIASPHALHHPRYR